MYENEGGKHIFIRSSKFSFKNDVLTNHITGIYFLMRGEVFI